MPKPKPQLSIYALMAVIVVSPNHNFQPCIAKTRNKYCNLTVCGNATISYLFQLSTQPPKCDDHRFKLNCDSNNYIILSLNHGKFYIQSIWYKYSTIRAIDMASNKRRKRRKNGDDLR
ncbi:hypothetical protein ES332_A10G232000v1 [Gossypium tomentosum]|uniref:Wall-associated receptor kinase galacturonan-binding domain-containing protein n=1 Tax=Gossypium tomentosum TaxID=34277 RepID=A0A5D2NWR9_GOSTO|nr:hypothetical protein ES332_A10G232000v1 [Gossypium tomentosum]